VVDSKGGRIQDGRIQGAAAAGRRQAAQTGGHFCVLGIVLSHLGDCFEQLGNFLAIFFYQTNYKQKINKTRFFEKLIQNRLFSYIKNYLECRKLISIKFYIFYKVQLHFLRKIENKNKKLSKN